VVRGCRRCLEDNRERVLEHQAAEPSASGASEQHRFDVFISYSRRDAAFARRLQRALGSYTPPADLAVPQRRLRVFRDESDFQGTEYQAAIEQVLRSSAKLLVVCSPNSRSSRYVGGEIASFAALRGKEHIVSVLIAGVPNNEEPGTDGQKAFHDELVMRLPVPLAADYRGWDDKRDRIERDRFESGWYKLLADIYAGYGVDRSAIEQREKRRQQRTRRLRMALLSGLTLVLASLTVWALISRQEAIAQRNTAQSRFLAAQSMSGAHTFDVAMLLAAAAQRTAPTFEAWEALFVGLQRQPALQRFLRGVDGTVQRIFVGRNGACATAWTESDKTVVWDLSTGRVRLQVAGYAIPDHSCASLVVAPDDGIERRPLDQFHNPLWSVTDGSGRPTAWTVDPADATLAVAHTGGRLLLRDMADGHILRELAASGSTWTYLQFSADGRALAAMDNRGMVHRWNATTLAPLSPAAGCGTSRADVFAISRDLRWCASGGPGRLVVTDLTSIAAQEIDLGTPWILALDFSPDGRTLMAGVQGGELQFWNLETALRDGARARPVAWSEHRSDVTAAAFSQDGGAIVSSARDRSLIVWQTAPRNRLVSEVARTAETSVIAVDTDAARIVIGTPAGDLLVLPIGPEPAPPPVPLTNVGKAVTAVALRKNGEILAGTADGEMVGVHGQSPRRAFAAAEAKPIVRIRLNADESRAAAITENGVVTVWDVATGARIATFAGDSPREGRGAGILPGVDAVFEPGGSRVVSVHGDQQAFLWDWTAGAPRFVPLPFRPIAYFSSAAFASDGRTIALGTGMYEGEVVLIDAANAGEPVTRLPGHQLLDVTGLAFSPDGRLLFSGGFDAAVGVWDVAGRRRIGEMYRADGSITSLAYATSGRAVTAMTERGGVLRWDLDLERWLENACRIANRELSPEERARYMDGAAGPTICAPPGGP
jgi:WD40 repeat protein